MNATRVLATGRDVMDAVADCARRGVAMPPELAAAFLRRHGFVRHMRAATWDSPHAFGDAHPSVGRVPTRSQLARMRRKRWFLNDLERLFGEGWLQRTPAGFADAADMLGITPAEARRWLPKTRANRTDPEPAASELDSVMRKWGRRR